MGAAAAATVDYTQYVNPFMGSEGPTPGEGYGGGNIFVGAARPFGVTKVGIDSTATNWSTAVLNGGWTPSGNVTAISTYCYIREFTRCTSHITSDQSVRHDA